MTDIKSLSMSTEEAVTYCLSNSFRLLQPNSEKTNRMHCYRPFESFVIILSALLPLSQCASIPPLQARTVPTFNAYHGASSATHLQNFEFLASQGYRMISLCLYGTTTDPLYTAVWVQRTGPAWQATNFTDTSGLQSFVTTWINAGYVITQLSAVGPADAPMWTAVVEQYATNGLGSGAGQWTWGIQPARQQAATQGFAYWNNVAHENNQRLSVVTSYGTGTDLTIAAVWLPNDYSIYRRWHAHTMDDINTYQTTSNEETSLPGWRPYLLAVSSDEQITSVFDDSQVGAWQSRHNMTSAQYQATFNEQTANGLYPIIVQAGGSGSDAMYAAIFAASDIPNPKQFSIDGGSVNPIPVIPSSTADIHNIMRTFMANNTVRNAQLSVYKGGTAILEDAYDLTEHGNRATSISDQFFLAGLSEIFVAAAIQILFIQGSLRSSQNAYSTLGLSGGLDANADSITIQQLLDHESGYAPDISGYDPVYHTLNIAEQTSLNAAPDMLQVIEYVYHNRSLDASSGTYHDAAYNYLMLAAIIEKVTGGDYFTFLSTTFITPSSLNLIALETYGRVTTEIIPEDEGLGFGPNPLFNTLYPAVYGGDGLSKETAIGPLGLGGSASDLAKFIGTHAVQGVGARAPGKSRVSSIAGGLAYAESRDDGYDWAFTVNTRDWSGQDGRQPWQDLVNAFNAEITTQYG